jgi:hypothetical protein
VKDPERAAFQIEEDHYARRTGVRAQRVPDKKPPWWFFLIDQQERFWVARHGEGFHLPESESERNLRMAWGAPPSEWWEPLVMDVIEPNGRFLGTLEFPTHQTRVVVARNDKVWVIEEGEWGEQYVVRYRTAPG